MACIRLKPKQGLLEHAESSLLHTHRPRNGEPALLRDRPLSPGELLKEDTGRECAPEASLALHIIENANIVQFNKKCVPCNVGPRHWVCQWCGTWALRAQLLWVGWPQPTLHPWRCPGLPPGRTKVP